MFIRRIIAILIAGLSVACQPTTQPTFPMQAQGTIHIEGDSVTLTTYFATGVSDDWFTSTNYAPGSTATASWTGIAARENIPKKVSEGKADTIVWALGLNDMLNNGWTREDELIWTDILVNKVPPTSCVVIVKPWALPADTTRSPAALETVRTFIENFSADHENFVLVDWKPILEAHPEYSSDGVHIDAGTGGAEARDAMYREGIRSCG